MSFYTDWTNIWPYRAAVSVDCTGGGGTVDISIAIPKDWDEFWTTINQTDGRDIRVCDADGFTLLTYQLVGFVLATRTLSIEVDGYAAPAAEMVQIWIYWGASGVSSAGGSFVAASAKSAYIAHCAPPPIVLPCHREQFRGQRPRNTIAKATGETIFVAFHVRPMLVGRRQGRAYGRSLTCDEIDYVSYQVLAGAAPQASMIDETKIRYYDGYVRILLKAGADATGYTVETTVVTVEGQTFVFYAWLYNQNVDEA